jgi:hypothetical protein
MLANLHFCRSEAFFGPLPCASAGSKRSRSLQVSARRSAGISFWLVTKLVTGSPVPALLPRAEMLAAWPGRQHETAAAAGPPRSRHKAGVSAVAGRPDGPGCGKRLALNPPPAAWRRAQSVARSAPACSSPSCTPNRAAAPRSAECHIACWSCQYGPQRSRGTARPCRRRRHRLAPEPTQRGESRHRAYAHADERMVGFVGSALAPAAIRHLIVTGSGAGMLVR